MADIFEKITGKIDKGIKTVTSTSKGLIETTKLKREIKDLQASIDTRFQALGKKVYQMLNMDTLNEDELKPDRDEIALLFKKITELEEAIKKAELEALKARYGDKVVVCQKCGARNRADARFCIKCGSAMVIETETEGINCPTCGAPLKEGVKFCPRCGNKI